MRLTLLVSAAAIAFLLLLRARRCTALTAHDDCWEAWRDVYCDELARRGTA
jgi:hypothetical protein